MSVTENDSVQKKNGGQRDGSGRKLNKPEEHIKPRVHSMSKYGVPIKSIAFIAGMSERNLVKHYAKELAEGRAEAQEAVGKSLFERATVDRDTAAMIWYSKAQMGWKETKAHEITGKDGDAVAFKEIKRTIVKAPNVEDNA